jgi:hypothetical protein
VAAFAVITLARADSTWLVDYGFTDSLRGRPRTSCAAARATGVEWLSRFYFGSATGKEGGLAARGGREEDHRQNLDEIDARAISTIPIGLAEDGRPVVVRVGRYGPYVQVGDDGAEDQQKASLPEDLAPDECQQDQRREGLQGSAGEGWQRRRVCRTGQAHQLGQGHHRQRVRQVRLGRGQEGRCPAEGRQDERQRHVQGDDQGAARGRRLRR